MTDLTALTAKAAVDLIAAGEIKPQEVFVAYAGKIDGQDGELNCYLYCCDPPSDFNVAAPLAGLPLAVKDVFCTEGIPSTAGSKILEGYRPPYQATSVARLVEAGSTVLGKTNMDEFAMGSSNENSAYGAVKNPWNRERVPGGSSGGSAAAVAAGLAPWSIGTDTGGSVRQPASLCGIVGLKPTYGSISRYGMIAFASSLDQCGPLTRDVTDAALLFKYLVGDHDPCDSTSIKYPEEIQLPRADSLGGLKFGIPSELAYEGLEEGVSRVFNETVAKIEELGGSVEEMHLPHASYGISAYYVIAPAEASANLARFDGVRFGLRVDGDGSLVEMYKKTRATGFGDEVKRRIMLGTYALSSGYYDAYYGKAQRVRTKIVEDFKSAFENFDFVITPTSPSVAFKLGERTQDPLSMYLSDYCTVPMSLAGIPAISIPGGLSEGLPVGIQLCSPAFTENKLLNAAYALEQAIGFKGLQP